VSLADNALRACRFIIACPIAPRGRAPHHRFQVFFVAHTMRGKRDASNDAQVKSTADPGNGASSKASGRYGTG